MTDHIQENDMKMYKKITALALVLLTYSAASSAAEGTITQVITRIQYDGAGDQTYLVGPSKWGAPSCVNATYGWIPNSVLGRKQILAIALAAQASGKRMSLVGNCHTNKDYFVVTYVYIIN